MGNGVMDVTGTTSAASATTTAKEKSALDKDAFLKLLVAQLSHQDPLKPVEGTEFVAQLSQFAMVEQAIAQSSKLEVLSTQVRGLSNNEATALVGKTVTVRGKGIAFDGSLATGASASLSAPAAKVVVRIEDALGKTVRTLDLGPKNAGPMPIAWDGKDDLGNVASKGNYTIKIEATAQDGSTVATSQDVSGSVTKVTFEKGYPELLLDSGVTAPISDLVSVSGGAQGGQVR
jgi:flagellar basal-body rod modification protein FlgD